MVEEFEHELDLWGIKASFECVCHDSISSMGCGGGCRLRGSLVLYAGEPGRLRNVAIPYSHGMFVGGEKGGVSGKGERLRTGSFLLFHSTFSPYHLRQGSTFKLSVCVSWGPGQTAFGQPHPTLHDRRLVPRVGVPVSRSRPLLGRSARSCAMKNGGRHRGDITTASLPSSAGSKL